MVPERAAPSAGERHLHADGADCQLREVQLVQEGPALRLGLR